MKPVTHRSWRGREADADTVAGLTRSGVAPLLARLLAHRGVCTPDDADAYLNPVLSRLHDPMALAGMDQAVARLARALKAGERVCVHGDYDVDGVTSCALLLSFFRKIGLDCCHYIPKRLTEGYGLSEQGVAAAARAGATVLVTVDCGITAVNEARLCREAGLDLIVTDHHAPGEVLPDACAVINPLQPGCRFPFKSLAGVGVAFHLVVALRARLRADGHFAGGGEPDLKEYLDLVALGTIADVVPLLGINRVLVSYGLKQLCTGDRIGIEALKEVAGITGEVGCGAVGFRLAPRINAAGRLEDASLGLELLLCRDLQRARDIAKELDEANVERQALERATFEEARSMLEQGACSGRKSIVLGSELWHPGVIGIVASRIVELFHRPVILFAFDGETGRGSGRSISRFHLLDAIKECADHLLRFGGHSHAAGLSIAQEELERFALRFDEAAQEVLDAEALTPTLSFDLELGSGDITADLVRQLEQMKPFGMGNPEPLFVLKGAEVLESRVLKGGHLKLRVGEGGKSFDAIGFGLAEAGLPQGRVDILFSPAINVWNGRSSLQLTVKDLRAEGTC
ncbi:single-stranded-DNA-specific exonuclease RecJ [Geomonas nitrogeniifigens]|uniref:Single-stranded-DNA-specific exonuclease RecJ n=1 Tax=Geomonas diazotrophica TaxID=2843197 RepID=A0ABX8JNM5_9BACT|nr:single-stranded-DNA-specific exonuclease RecJ [Geomonas nitrogeniifigens]QWV99182.1 single-stranded-DNA-specific exonuclease RecJ [Geomonas nitrogeniifigens]QXE88351.1 single-stranded-DNA-specific exonuclease RecJ [Geomonas nitrogeniifigens]